MATKKKTAKRTTTKKATKKKKSAKPRVRFEGSQALIPGVKPKKKPKAADTYTASGVDGEKRTIAMPEAPELGAYTYRRRPHGWARTYTARMELRLMPEQATAWDRVAAGARLSRAEWIRNVCDAAVAAGAK